jgi:hypothetical protein
VGKLFTRSLEAIRSWGQNLNDVEKKTTDNNLLYSVRAAKMIKDEEEEKEALCEILTTEALRLLRINLEFQDKELSLDEICKFTGIRLLPNYPVRHRLNFIKKSFLVYGLLLDLIVNKPEIIISIVTNLYENYLNLLKENKISANKKFDSFLAQNIRSLLLRNRVLSYYFLAGSNVGDFIFKVCKTLLQKNINDLVKIVEKHGKMIGTLRRDQDSFKAYIQFLDIYSCVLEAPINMYVLSTDVRSLVFSKFQYLQEILKFYRKYYMKLYSEFLSWQKFIENNNNKTDVRNVGEYKKELNFASAFTIYYLMVKTIECIAKGLSKIKTVADTCIDERQKEKEIKLRLKKLIVDYTFNTYTHFCEKVLSKIWSSDWVVIYHHFAFSGKSFSRTVVATLLEETYRLVHKDLEFDLLYHTTLKGNEHTYCNKCKPKIFRIVRCKSIIERWVVYLHGYDDMIWKTKFEK